MFSHEFTWPSGGSILPSELDDYETTMVGKYKAYKFIYENETGVPGDYSELPYLLLPEDGIENNLFSSGSLAYYTFRAVDSSNSYYRSLRIDKGRWEDPDTGVEYRYWLFDTSSAQRINASGTKNTLAIPIALYGLN